MGNVLAILKRDILRMLKVPAAWVITLGLIFIPPMYAWFNIAGFWNPYGNTQGIQVVVANNDRGTDSDLLGQANLGDQIVDQLKANDQLGWTFTDQAEAMRRVESGDAYAAIIIPKNFSERIAGVVTGGERPELNYYVNEKASAIAPKITDIGAGTVDNQVNSTFVSTVSEVLTEAVNSATDHVDATAGSIQTTTVDALDGAAQDVASTRATIADLTAKLNDVPNQTQTARQTVADLQRLATDAGNGLGNVSTILTNTQNGLNTFVSGTSGALDTGSSLLSQSAQQTTDGVHQIAGGLTVANGAVGDAVTTLQNVNAANATIIERLNAIAGQLPDNALTQAVQNAVAKLQHQNDNTAQTLNDAKTLNTDTANTIESVSALATNLNGAVQTTIDNTGAARKTITEGALPQLGNGLNTLAQTTGTLSGTLTTQTTLVAQTNTLLDQLDQAAEDGITALDDTDRALAGLQTKLDTIATDIRALDTSNVLRDLLGDDMLDANGKLDTTRIAEFMLSPTVLETKTLYPVDSYGSGMAPLFTNMALWVGAFALAVIVKLETDDEGIEGMTITQGYLGRFLLIAILAVAQGLATTIGNLIIGVQTVNAAAYILTGVITSLVYASLIYALSSTLLHVGKGICVALIILQIPGASGLYPIEMMPDFFRDLYPYFPFTYSIDAFRETIGGFYGNQWFDNIGRLLVFAVVAFAFGILVRPLLANVNRLFAREIEESDMIIGEPVRMPGTEYRLSAAVRVLADHDDYRASIERRAARFAELYPKLKLGALIAGIAVPVVLAVTFSLTPNTKLEALLAWLIWILLIIAFLIAIEYTQDSLRRQTELGNLDDDAIRRELHAREQAKKRVRDARRRKAKDGVRAVAAPAVAAGNALADAVGALPAFAGAGATDAGANTTTGTGAVGEHGASGMHRADGTTGVNRVHGAADIADTQTIPPITDMNAMPDYPAWTSLGRNAETGIQADRTADRTANDTANDTATNGTHEKGTAR